MGKKTVQSTEKDILESLKEKEDEFEKALSAAEERAHTYIRDATEKASYLETGLEDELKAIKEQVIEEENIKNEAIIMSVNDNNRAAIDKIKKQFLHNKETAIQFIVEAVIPQTLGTGSKEDDKKNE